MKTLLLTLLLPLAVFAQSDLPTYGKIEQIKDARRVYVASDDEESRKRIIKALAKDRLLTIADSPTEADFYLEYNVLSREALSTSDSPAKPKDRKERSQMRAFVIRPDKTRVIVWSDTSTRDTEEFLGMKMYDSGRNEGELTKSFLKALKKARGEK